MTVIDWRLQEVMQARGIANASRLEAAFQKSMGLQISRVSLDKLLKKQPLQIRLEMAQYLCTLLQVPLDQLLIITPEPIIRHPILVQPFGNKDQPSEGMMVDPGRFF